MRPHVLLYDSDCGFCVWALAKVLAWDRRRRLRPLALQDPESGSLLAALDEESRMASWHVVAPTGQVASAGRALAPLLRLLPAGRPLAPLFEHFPRVADRLYFAVADRRGALGKLVPDGARRRARGRIQRRGPLARTGMDTLA
ncbi:MAG TPA: DCC1-like thiol-disulfide oxidoreductase family protein [Thermoleophilaceae bacterium]|jgi:predicted DCC family thiol-disulfide oxidoreductase YuxK